MENMSWYFALQTRIASITLNFTSVMYYNMFVFLIKLTMYSEVTSGFLEKKMNIENMPFWRSFLQTVPCRLLVCHKVHLILG